MQMANAACSSDSVRGTIYYIPHADNFCPGDNEKIKKFSQLCSPFRKAVKLQGSGILPGHRLVTYDGKIRPMGDCDTARGSTGHCLIPFISVAADMNHFNAGDIISVPSMKGTIVTLANGQQIEHPGFFYVSDVGGAINGPNRFDFFTGTFAPKSELNAFGYKAAPADQMIDKNHCSHQFKRIKYKSAEWVAAKEKIQKAMASPIGSVKLASSGNH